MPQHGHGIGRCSALMKEDVQYTAAAQQPRGSHGTFGDKAAKPQECMHVAGWLCCAGELVGLRGNDELIREQAQGWVATFTPLPPSRSLADWLGRHSRDLSHCIAAQEDKQDGQDGQYGQDG